MYSFYSNVDDYSVMQFSDEVQSIHYSSLIILHNSLKHLDIKWEVLIRILLFDYFEHTVTQKLNASGCALIIIYIGKLQNLMNSKVKKFS